MRLLNSIRSIRLSKELDVRLEQLARVTGRSKSFYVNQALEDHLQGLEDRYVNRRRPAWQAAGEARERVVPLYELERALGLDD